jgi:hypothetical protein
MSDATPAAPLYTPSKRPRSRRRTLEEARSSARRVNCAAPADSYEIPKHRPDLPVRHFCWGWRRQPALLFTDASYGASSPWGAALVARCFLYTSIPRWVAPSCAASMLYGALISSGTNDPHRDRFSSAQAAAAVEKEGGKAAKFIIQPARRLYTNQDGKLSPRAGRPPPVRHGPRPAADSATRRESRIDTLRRSSKAIAMHRDGGLRGAGVPLLEMSSRFPRSSRC